MSRVLAALVSFALLAACSGGDSSKDRSPTAPIESGPPTPSPPPPPPPPVPVPANVAVDQASVLLPQPGATHQLTASAFDAQGVRIETAFTWTSSDESVITVDAAGRVTAHSIGSAHVTAAAGNVTSQSVLVIAAQTASGVKLLTDAQIGSDISMVDPSAPPAFGNPFEVTLTDTTGIQVGDLLLGAESEVLAGRVLAVQEIAANSIRVRMELAPIDELLTQFAVNETVDLTQGEIEIPQEIATRFDVTRNGKEFTFTPRATASADIAARKFEVRASSDPEGTYAIPPFGECASSVGNASTPFPVALSAAPTFTVAIDGTVSVVATQQNGVERIEYKGTPTFKADTALTIQSAVTGKLECKAELVRKPVKLPGLIGLLIGGEYSWGIGFELSGELSIASASIGASFEASGTIAADITCPPGGSCSFHGDMTSPSFKATPKLTAPSLNQLRLQPSLHAFGFASADLGNPFVQQLQFKAIEAKVGPKFAGSFTFDALQIDDTQYKSDYKLQGDMKAGVGAGLGDFLKTLGLESISLIELNSSTAIGRSPEGGVTSDRPFYIQGDLGQIDVALDATTAAFTPFGPYNVSEILLVRRTGAVTSEVLSRQAASAGQTQFTLPFTAPASFAAEELFAFAVTTILPLDLLKLELGNAKTASDRLGVAGGTFNNGAANLQTALLLRVRGANGNPPTAGVEVTITGPAGWNGGVPRTVSYPANLRRQFYILPAPPISGTYRATAVIDGDSAAREFTIDASQQLAQANATIDFSSPGINGIEAAWEPVAGASTYIARVFDTTSQTIVPPVDITAATASHLAVILAGAHQNNVQIMAFNHDMSSADAEVPAQFNFSLRALPITMRLTVSPPNIELSPGNAALFEAQLTGLSDTSVIWRAARGSITQDGAHTASTQEGDDYFVTATSVANSALRARALVSISGDDDDGGGGGGGSDLSMIGKWIRPFAAPADTAGSQNCRALGFIDAINAGAIISITNSAVHVELTNVAPIPGTIVGGTHFTSHDGTSYLTMETDVVLFPSGELLSAQVSGRLELRDPALPRTVLPCYVEIVARSIDDPLDD